ncbi:MAG: Flp family type IVb pilin [Marmoricola sp.]
MTQLFVALQTFFAARTDDERGATAVEYGLIVALIAAVIVTVVGTLGGQIDHAFQTVVAAHPPAG